MLPDYYSVEDLSSQRSTGSGVSSAVI